MILSTHGILSSISGVVPITATGGTITYSGGMTIHTFTSSGTFTVLTAPASPTVEALVVAGGGGGGVLLVVEVVLVV